MKDEMTRQEAIAQINAFMEDPYAYGGNIWDDKDLQRQQMIERLRKKGLI